MQKKATSWIAAIVCVAVAIPAFAQYGHPLKGSWSGDWWLVKGQNNRILLDFNFVSTGYGSQTLTGVFNPGTDQAPMQKLTLTPPDVIGAGKAAIAARDSAVAKSAMPTAAPPKGRGAPTPVIKDNVSIATDPWLLHFEVDSKDAAGKPVHYVVDGKMENLGAAYSRVITGTWKSGTLVGNFKVVRN